jgi:hypothetical protein
MFEVKFNVYYSISENGPWILANSSPLDADTSGHNSYTVSGLDHGATYFLSIIGGMVEDNEFFPMITQHIGPNTTGLITDINALLKPALAKGITFAPMVDTDDNLGHEFTVASIV